ncbi:hypothetical protein P9D51_10890 [Bacillus sonorensis]|uniref:hypothetical protein n=1 Tax=Bacillus sonorensis TaxID=119858 RepID=UPI002DB6E4C0|nr:hypothetical protein [Bacillus sonorensis]MEC1426610.1 hypothetical protein [Bacillus sonorensis]
MDCEIRYWRNWTTKMVCGVIETVDPVGGALRIDGVEVPFREIVWGGGVGGCLIEKGGK